MLVVNFSHPLTARQHRQLEELTGSLIEQVIDRPAQFDHSRPFEPQARELIDSAGLSAEEWQTRKLLLVPPALASIACCVLTELHGRAGYFVSMVRLRPVSGQVPPEFEVAEVLNLQAVRDTARLRRSNQS